MTAITTAEAAARLGCHIRTVQRRIKSGHIAADKRDGRWWVDEASVEEWQARNPGRPGGDKAKMLAAYANPDIPVAAIAAEHGVTPGAVYKAASRANMHRREMIRVANSYGFDNNVPADAEYGVYDSENGEWTGKFYSSVEDAQAAADQLRDDSHLGIVSVTDDDDWL